MRLKLLILAIVCKLGISDGQMLSPQQLDFAIRQLYDRTHSKVPA